MSRPIDLVLSGSGTLIPCHLGAVARLRAEGFEIRRVAGTSGGAIVAAGIAHGFTADQMLETCRELLKGDQMLDAQATWWKPWGFFRGYGLHAFDRAHREIRKRYDGALAGNLEDAELEWGVFVVDLETRRPVFLHSKRHGHVPTADAVIASASIPLFFRARPVAGALGLYVDGGLATNFGLGVWDDEPNRDTIGIRFQSGAGGDRRRVRSIFDFVRALLEVALENINRTHLSAKRFANVIEISSSGNGLDFSLTEEQITDRFAEGWEAVGEWLDR